MNIKEEFLNVKNSISSLTSRVLIAIIIIGVIGFVLATSVFIVDETEDAVILTLGKYTGTLGPGLRFKLPFGIQKNYNVQTKVVQRMSFGFRTSEDNKESSKSEQNDFNTQDQKSVKTSFNPEESEMLTGDLNIVDVQWIIQYYIVDPYEWTFSVNEREKTIRDISQSVVNMLVGDIRIFNVLGPSRAYIELSAKDKMNEILKTYKMGIQINNVRLQNIVPPAGTVQDAFEEVNKSIQNMNKLINEAEQIYNTEIPKAKGESLKMIENAKGYKEDRINTALGDTERFKKILEEYKRDPKNTKTRLYFETMEEVFKNKDNLKIIDKSLKGILPTLNLDN